MGFQETKQEGIDMQTASFFWGSKAHIWASVPAVGAFGGLALLWDPDRPAMKEVL